MKWVIAVVALAFVACGSSTPKPGAGSCENVKHLPGGATTHVTCDAACGNGEVPPTGGPHCPTTLSCRAFSDVQPLCNWVHNLEHGHAVLLFNCPDGCADITAKLGEIQKTHPRTLVTAYPRLPGKVGAVVWGYSWVGDSVDEGAIDCIFGHQDEEAPEPGIPCAG